MTMRNRVGGPLHPSETVGRVRPKKSESRRQSERESVRTSPSYYRDVQDEREAQVRAARESRARAARESRARAARGAERESVRTSPSYYRDIQDEREAQVRAARESRARAARESERESVRTSPSYYQARAARESQARAARGAERESERTSPSYSGDIQDEREAQVLAARESQARAARGAERESERTSPSYSGDIQDEREAQVRAARESRARAARESERESVRTSPSYYQARAARESQARAAREVERESERTSPSYSGDIQDEREAQNDPLPADVVIVDREGTPLGGAEADLGVGDEYQTDKRVTQDFGDRTTGDRTVDTDGVETSEFGDLQTGEGELWTGGGELWTPPSTAQTTTPSDIMDDNLAADLGVGDEYQTDKRVTQDFGDRTTADRTVDTDGVETSELGDLQIGWGELSMPPSPVQTTTPYDLPNENLILPTDLEAGKALRDQLQAETERQMVLSPSAEELEKAREEAAKALRDQLQAETERQMVLPPTAEDLERAREEREAELRADQDILERKVAPVPDADRLADLSAAQSDFVIYEHEGRNLLIPKAVAEDFEFQQKAYAEEVANIQALKSTPSYWATKLQIRDGPTLDPNSYIDVTDLNADERFATTRALDLHLQEQAKFAEDVGKVYLKGLNQASFSHNRPVRTKLRQSFDKDFRSQLSEDENKQLDAYLEAAQEQQSKKTIQEMKTLAGFIPGVGLILAARDAADPTGPGGRWRTPDENKQLALELGFSALDVLPFGAAVGAASDAVRTGVRVAAPTEITTFGKTIPTGGGYVSGAWGSSKTIRIPKNIDNALEQQYNVNLALGQGREAVIDMGDQGLYSVKPSPVQKALAAQNPDQLIMTHAGDAGFFEAGRIAPRLKGGDPRFKDDVENRTYFAPEPPVEFMNQSAFGAKPTKPGVVVTPTDLSKGPQLVFPSAKQGPTDPNIIRMYQEDIGVLGHRIEPSADEVQMLTELGATKQQAYEMASRPHIEGAFDRPGKQWARAYEVEDTLPTSVGHSEFVGVLPELRPGPFIEGGGRIYAPEGFRFESYGDRFRTNVGALRAQIKDTLTKPKAIRDNPLQRYEGPDLRGHETADIGDLGDNLDARLRPTDPADVGTAQLVSKELSTLTPEQQRLIELGRKPTDELAGSRYSDDPIAQSILERRREYDQALAAERAGVTPATPDDADDVLGLQRQGQLPDTPTPVVDDLIDDLGDATPTAPRDAQGPVSVYDDDFAIRQKQTQEFDGAPGVDDLIDDLDDATPTAPRDAQGPVSAYDDDFAIRQKQTQEFDGAQGVDDLAGDRRLDLTPDERVRFESSGRAGQPWRLLDSDDTRRDSLIDVGDGDRSVLDGDGDRSVLDGDGDRSVLDGDGDRSVLDGDGDRSVLDGDGDRSVLDGDGDRSVLDGDGDRSVLDGDGDRSVLDGDGDRSVLDGDGDRSVLDGDGDRSVLDGDGDRSVLDGDGDRPIINGGGDRPIINGGGDRPIINGGGDRPIINGGGDRPIINGGGDRPIINGGGDRPTLDVDRPTLDVDRPTLDVDRPTLEGDGGRRIPEGDGDRPVLDGGGDRPVPDGGGDTTTPDRTTPEPTRDIPDRVTPGLRIDDIPDRRDSRERADGTGRVRPRHRPRPPSDESPTEGPTPAPRPPGSFPRTIAHDERVMYSYNPESDEYSARIIESSEPVVTAWDDSPPVREERPVGTYDVTPDNDGTAATNVGRVTIPDDIKAQLQSEAEQRGEPVSTVTTLRYEHDLDSRDTTTRAANAERDGQSQDTRSIAERVEGAQPKMARAQLLRERRHAQQGGELSPAYQRLLKQVNAQAEGKRGSTGGNRRRSSSRAGERRPSSYRLPEIVIVQEGGRGPRIGGL